MTAGAAILVVLDEKDLANRGIIKVLLDEAFAFNGQPRPTNGNKGPNSAIGPDEAPISIGFHFLNGSRPFH